MRIFTPLSINELIFSRAENLRSIYNPFICQKENNFIIIQLLVKDLIRKISPLFCSQEGKKIFGEPLNP